MPAPNLVQQFAQTIAAAGGRTWLVGGVVRDKLLGRQATDIDLEVYGLPLERIIAIAQTFGPVDQVGRQFGILKLKTEDRLIDIALPRQESKSGRGHRGFAITTDQNVTIQQALARRDFTINAMAEDPLTGEVIDPFNGREDLKQRRLGIVDTKTFLDDPLRIVRAFQFAARFELEADEPTLSILHSGIDTIAELPPERLYPEWEKLFLLAERPSIGLQLAHEVGFFEKYAPSIHRLANTEQDPQHHPEGNVWTHTLLSVDWARRIAPDNLAVILAVFLHDIGKSTTTAIREDRIISHGHDLAAIEPAQQFLVSQGFPPKLIEHVVPLIREHMHPGQLFHHRSDLGPGAVRRLANRLKPATITELTQVATADYAGRHPSDHNEIPVHPASQWLLAEAAKAGVARTAPSPILQGRDLQALGWKPGPLFGQILALAEALAEQNLDRETILGMLSAAKTPERAIQHLQARQTPLA